jgi:hypothetical protein
MDRNEQKRKHEAAVLSRFLENRGLAYAPRGDSDCHDGLAMNGDKAVAELELTDYVVDHDPRMGSVQRMSVGMWDQSIWQVVDVERRNRSVLQNVMATVEFSDDPPRNRDAKAMGFQIVGAAAKAWTERNEQKVLPMLQPEPVTSVFVEDRTGRTYNFQQFGTAYINPDADAFPLVAAHVQQIHLSECSSDWPEWWGPDMRGGCVTYCAQSLCRILNEKTQRLQNRGQTGLPVWLVILCDLFADVRTMIYPRDELHLAAALEMFQTCGYDWRASPFAEIWLMSQAYGHSTQVDIPEDDR